VRPPAQVGEGPVAVQGDRAHAVVRSEVADQLHLVVLALGAEPLERRFGSDVGALEGLVRLDVLAHPLFDRLEVLVGQLDSVGKLEVVVEAVLDRRPDRDLGAGIELHHRRRHHVGGVVADQVERVLAAVGDDLDALIVAQRRRQVTHLAADPHGERSLRQARADRSREICAGGAVRELQLLAVGKGHLHRSDANQRARRRRSARKWRKSVRLVT
jgi:hypothetical protein